MPSLTIQTNVPRSFIPSGFVSEATRVFQEAIGKPLQYISVCVVPDCMMEFGGSSEPCALMSITSIGKLGVAENKSKAAVIFQLVKKEIGIDGKRAYLEFHDEERANIGYDGTTFAS